MTSIPERLQASLADRYRIERELGAGGMATVYLADDLKHHRQVALKVLRPELTASLGPERFLREVTIAANLQHPHILPLYDSGEADGFLFYVMPYVEGPSVRQRLVREGELPVAETVRILRDVADAMAYAHSRGVVHRDIKPENVMLSGRHAMVTDFGVAKAVSEATGRQALTTAGIALGTPSYMAPEQAAADPHTDHRADIYAFGAMAYELLTGRPPFVGPTPQAILAAHVMTAAEPVSQHRASIPPQLAALVMRCLEKKPADRFQSAEELIPQLEAVLTPSGGMTPTTTQPVAAARPARRFAVPALIAALVLVVVLGAVGVLVILRRPLTLTTTNAVAVTDEPGVEYQPVLSPDGRQVAFVAFRDGRTALTVRSAVAVAGGGELRPVETMAGSQNLPAWSPDGEFLRFLNCTGDSCSWREVGRIGGAARAVELPRQHSTMAWSREGAHAAFVVNDSIYVYTVAGRTTRLLAVHTDPWAQHSLAWSPDGRWIAYVNGNPPWRFQANTAACSIWIVAVADGRRVAVTAEDHLNVSPAWLDARHLVFISNREGAREVYVVEVGPAGPRGEPQKVAGGTDAHSISVSADGTRLAFAKMSVRQNVWVYPIRASGPVSIRDGRQVTSGTQVVEMHDVSPDGQWLVYDSNRRGNADIYKLRLDGGEPIPIVTSPGDDFAPRWSPDGREIVYYGGPSGDVFVVSAEGGTPSQLTNQPGFDNYPVWSPDGLRIAFQSDRTGRFEIWRLARERVGSVWGHEVKLTDFGCVGPGWAPDGSGLLCRSGNPPELVLVSPSGTVLWRRDLAAAGLTGVGLLTFSEDGSTIYLGATRAGRDGIWALPRAGGEPRPVVLFDDPRLTALGGAISVRRERLYLTVAQYESDIWVMDLKR
jgi:serine/threonine-protein kinase